MEPRAIGPPHLAKPPSREVVLLVDDDPYVREPLSHILAKAGYQVLEAGDGQEALEVSAQHPGPIHVLVADVVLPRMTGKELAQSIRALRPALKVVFVSGYSFLESAAHGLLDPEQPFLPKPFAGEVLAEVIRKLLANGHSAPT